MTYAGSMTYAWSTSAFRHAKHDLRGEHDLLVTLLTQRVTEQLIAFA